MFSEGPTRILAHNVHRKKKMTRTLIRERARAHAPVLSESLNFIQCTKSIGLTTAVTAVTYIAVTAEWYTY